MFKKNASLKGGGAYRKKSLKKRGVKSRGASKRRGHLSEALQYDKKTIKIAIFYFN